MMIAINCHCLNEPGEQRLSVSQKQTSKNLDAKPMFPQFWKISCPPLSPNCYPGDHSAGKLFATLQQGLPNIGRFQQMIFTSARFFCFHVNVAEHNFVVLLSMLYSQQWSNAVVVKPG